MKKRIERYGYWLDEFKAENTPSCPLKKQSAQPSSNTSSVSFSCIRLSTVDKMGYEGRLSELDKSEHCFDLPGATENIKVRVVWEVSTGE